MKTWSILIFFGFMHVTVVVLLSQQIHQPPPCPLLFPAMAVTGTVRGLIQSAAIPAATVFFFESTQKHWEIM